MLPNRFRTDKEMLQKSRAAVLQTKGKACFFFQLSVLFSPVQRRRRLGVCNLQGPLKPKHSKEKMVSTFSFPDAKIFSPFFPLQGYFANENKLLSLEISETFFRLFCL